MSAPQDRLFTPRFFVMWGFSFTAFFSAFQILPTAPFHILDVGGSTFASGLFLGFLTYASAISAPFTGALADRLGHRRLLIICSLVVTGLSFAYGVSPSYQLTLALVVVHGVFWSGLLSASGAYMTATLPERRRAEGIGYWGLASVTAIAVGPPVGFAIYRYGWFWLCVSAAALNLAMAVIALCLKELPQSPAETPRQRKLANVLEWRVLAVSVSLFLYAFGYGGITSFSALYAAANDVAPKSIYLTTLALVILVTRPLAGRLGDRLGYERVFAPCLVLISIGLALLAFGGTRPWLVASAIVFGAGFGTAYPVFAAYIMRGVTPGRRGAAFGAILAAFDTGIGTGSTTLGWLVQRYDFPVAFGAASLLSAFALPYFAFAHRRFNTRGGVPDRP
jgi:MFS family permease